MHSDSTFRIGAMRSGVLGQYLRARGADEEAPKLVRRLFLFFVFTIPFEATDVGFASGWFSLAKMSGLLFFTCYAFYYSFVSRRRSFPRVPPIMWCFAVYIAVYVIRGFYISDEFFQFFIVRLLTLLQLTGLCWVSSDLLRENKFKKSVLLIYSFASVVLAVAILLGVPGFAEAIETYSGERLSSESQDPNTVAAMMSLSALITVAMAISSGSGQLLQKLTFLGLSFPPLAVVVKTGSRGGMAAFLAGLLVYLCPHRRRTQMIQSLIIASLIASGVVYAIAHDPAALSRWALTFEQGSLAGREEIIPVAAEMITERPLFGWGPTEFLYDLGQRMGRRWKTMDAHNLLLHLMLEVGLMGTIPFLIGLSLCVRSAWRDRSGSYGPLFISLMLTTLIVNMSISGLARKWTWLVFAFALSAAQQAKRTTQLNFPKLRLL